MTDAEIAALSKELDAAEAALHAAWQRIKSYEDTGAIAHWTCCKRRVNLIAEKINASCRC